MEKQFDIYNQKKAKVIEIIEQCCEKMRDEKVKQALVEKKEKLQSDRFVVSVFGHFSNGKSTFLNSLMGFDHEVLKEDDIASTATITRLKYADQDDLNCNQVDVIYRDGSIQRIEMDELSNFIARNGNVDVERTVREVILYVNSDFLKNGVEIVDTPGFNSTYELHSEIALQQVEKSDAAIFLFSCEKPGNSEELEFLKKVSRYMNRVFFVLNKFDLSDDQGRTEKESIYEKMQRMGISTEGKRMYPLSSKRAKEAIAEHNDEKLNASGLPEFTNALIEYLTGQGFVKDRILSPISSVFTILEKEKESVNDQIAACNKDKNDLNAEIQERKKYIRERESELSEKKRHISSSVKSEIQFTKSEVKGIATKVGDAQKERLSRINSRFDIRLASFEEMDMEAYVMFSNEWENAAEHFEAQLLSILDTSVDNENEFEKISEIIVAAIRSHLQLERISVDKPEFDFTELSNIDEEIEKANEEYNKAYDRVSNLYAVKKTKNNALAEIGNLEKDLERLKNRKEKCIEVLSNVPIEYGYEMKTVDEYVKRGKIGQFFLGDKRVERQKRVEYKDDRAKTEADKKIKEIEEELEKRSLGTREQVKSIMEKIDRDEFKKIDREIARAEVEEQAALEELMSRRQTQREEKRALETQIISVEKEAYLRELKKILDDMSKRIISFLDQSHKNFVSIISTCLDTERDEIAREKNSIEKMVNLHNQTPEEIEKNILELNQDIVSLNACMKAVDAVRGEV